MAEIGRKGAEATAKKLRQAGLAESELGPLRSHADAKRWYETIGRAVATGRLAHRDAQAATKAVEAWVKAHEGEMTAEVVDDLKGEVERLQREMKARPRLSVER